LHVTTRRIVEQLEGVTVSETHCHDGSVLRRLTPLTTEQDARLTILAALLAQIALSDLVPTLPAPSESAAVLLLLPRRPPWPERPPNRLVHPGPGPPCPGGNDLRLSRPSRRRRRLTTGVEPARGVVPAPPTAATARYSFVKVRNLG